MHMYLYTNNISTYHTDFSLPFKRTGRSNFDISAILLIFLTVLNDVALLAVARKWALVNIFKIYMWIDVDICK